MKPFTTKNRLMGSTVLTATLTVMALQAAMSNVLAQETTNDGDDVIVVTGSRLTANPNLTSINPVLSVSSEEISIRGTARIEDLTNVLPQVFAGQASEVSNAASGTANINLRGLGPTRTLTLVDGRRLPYGSATSSPTNVDIIPAQLIERIDILTGGASAVYGSDAVGGVANFILKDDFEGVELDVQYGFAQNGNDVNRFDGVLRAGSQPVPGSERDGEQVTLSLTLGANLPDDRGNVTIFASYEDTEEISQADRSISACALGADTGENSFGGLACVGSANFRLFGGPGGFFFQEEDGNLLGFAGGPTQTFNFGPFNFFQRPSEKYTLYGRGHYEITPSLEAFADISYLSNISDAQIAPTASFGIGAYSINCDNPLIEGSDFLDVFGCSAADIAAGNDVDGITLSHRNVEGGPRNSRLENTTFRFISGLRGTFAEHWDYEAFAQYSRTTNQQTSTNDFVIANLQQSLFAVRDDDGNIVCRDNTGGCAPYNIFQRGAGGESLVSQEALDFIQGVGIVTGETEQFIYGAHAQADLGEYGIKSPLSDAGIAILAGFEIREDQLRSTPDEISRVPGGGFTGVGGATLPVEGEVEATEFFAEMQIPLVAGKPFADEITLEGQYRSSDYDANGNNTTNEFDTDSFAIKLAWAPIDQIKLRAQFQQAVRAPNVIELYTGQDTNLPNLDSAGTNSAGTQLFDPCASSNPIASFEECARTGVTAAQFGSILDVISGQTQSITGGNPALNPETSDTITIGAIIEPAAIPGLTVTIDYFDIVVEDFITSGLGAQVILDNCLATGDASFCSLLTRAPNGSLASGTPGIGFEATNINIAELATEGVDVQANYTFDLANLGWKTGGDVALTYAATFLDTHELLPFPGGEAIECAGKFGNACFFEVNPDYRHRLLASWNTPLSGLNLSGTWRRFGTVTAQSDTAPVVDSKLRSRDYLDLSANYSINDTVALRGGVLNVFNSQAPVSPSAGPALGNGNTFPTIYDTGRFIFVGVNAKF